MSTQKQKYQLIVKILNTFLITHDINPITELHQFISIDKEVIINKENLKYLRSIQGEIFAEDMFTEFSLEWSDNMEGPRYIKNFIEYAIREFGFILISRKKYYRTGCVPSHCKNNETIGFTIIGHKNKSPPFTKEEICANILQERFIQEVKNMKENKTCECIIL